MLLLLLLFYSIHDLVIHCGKPHELVKPLVALDVVSEVFSSMAFFR